MTSESKMIVLKSSDNETFEGEEAVAIESQTIKHVIEDDSAKTTIYLKVSNKILAKVIEYCKKHVTSRKSHNESNKIAEDAGLESFDAEFVKVNQEVLLDLILTVNRVNIKSLLDLTSQTLADLLKKKTP